MQTPSARRGKPSPAWLVGADDFFRLRGLYQMRTGFPLVCVQTDGALFYGRPACRKCRSVKTCCAARRNAVQEALRWGEPCLALCPADFLVWGMPMMLNDLVLGGLVVVGVSPEKWRSRESLAKRVRQGIAVLQEMTEAYHLVNAACLRNQYAAAKLEREKAEAIHVFKTWRHPDMRLVYLREEPGLLAAVRGGDVAQARRIFARVLAGIAGDEIVLARGIAMELGVMCCRVAMEAGCNFPGLTALLQAAMPSLFAAAGKEAIQTWVEDLLSKTAAEIRRPTRDPIAAALARALGYIQAHLDQDISRNEVARVAAISKSHFSRLLHARTGQSFTQIVARLRVNRASELLAGTDKSLVQIAFECGFNDQSYFTRIFRKITGTTPADYRRAQARR